ncbi:LTA synthase family protein [Georgenia subflava]|uniref:Sulfatase-like hydrolase/transferase n=1 Tax=Georgenia subflava TaxID=1622177 RepID=A0A6N7ECQ9_9MICO|nr:LTA synthase family protein [Georgenia subflava]MPV35760.1 sulfatase-like hydrolase/transferase [Georgenia subflava]
MLQTAEPRESVESRPQVRLSGRHPGARRRAGRLADLVVRAVPTLCLSLAVAVVITMGVELVHVQTDTWLEPMERVRTWQTDLLALQLIVVWAVVGLVQAVVGRLWVAAVVVGTLAAVIAFADYQKMLARNEPLYPTDLEHLRDAPLLLEGLGINPALVLAGLIVLAAGVVAAALRARRRRGRRPWSERRAETLARVVGGAVAAAVLAGAVTFNEDGNPLRALWDRGEATWARWNQVENYAENGFVSGVLYNMPGTAMETPAGYSAARMAEIGEKYAAVAAETNAGRTGALTDTNVLVILSESLTDPTRLRGLEVEEDPIPFIHSLMERTTSGTMLSSDYGGGTANVEFEVLTGMSLDHFRPQMHTPYQMLVPFQERFPSFLRSVGAAHEAIAIHPYQHNFYRRDDVYATLGFTRAAFERDMVGTEPVENNPFISDAVTFDRVLGELRTSEDPMFVNVVTMQNHRPYAGKYADPIGVDGAMSFFERRNVEQYLRGLRYSDEALEHLVGDLEALDERTIVLYYGDHFPAIWSEQVKAANGGQGMYQTPWLVWANFDTEQVDAGAELLGPNHLMNQVLTAADAPVTPYAALLAAIAEEVPAAERGIMLDPDGRAVTETDLSPRARELLADYRLVQYDLAVGERYALEAMLDAPPG